MVTAEEASKMSDEQYEAFMRSYIWGWGYPYDDEFYQGNYQKSGGWRGGTYSYGHYEYWEELVEDDTLQKNLVSNLARAFQNVDNIIILEPSVSIKLTQMMMFMDEELEVYGKLIVNVEEYFGKKYPVVTDVIIPYQAVTKSHFESTPEHMAKWMDEINRNEDGSLRPAEEVSALTKRMMGHFHSHDSVGGCKYSYTDSDDMREHRDGMPFWIELIGSKKGIEGRIAIDYPVPIMVESQVIIKWWKGYEDMFKQLSGRVHTSHSKWVKNEDKEKDEEEEVKENEEENEEEENDEEEDSSEDDDLEINVYDDEEEYVDEIPEEKKVTIIPKSWLPEDEEVVDEEGEEDVEDDEDKELVATSNSKIKVISTTGRTLSKIDVKVKLPPKVSLIGKNWRTVDTNKNISSFLKGKEVDYGNDRIGTTDTTCILVKWDATNPVQLAIVILSEDEEKMLARMFNQSIREGEEILIEIWDNDDLSLGVYDGGDYVGPLLDVMHERDASLYDQYVELTKKYKVTEDWDMVETGDNMNPIPRSISWTNYPLEDSLPLRLYGLTEFGADVKVFDETLGLDGDPDPDVEGLEEEEQMMMASILSEGFGFPYDAEVVK